MPAPTTQQSIILDDGRRLGFAEYGAPAGRPVFHFHGSAASRLERPAAETMLAALRARFISVDRPGHGLSEFQPHPRLLDWPGDVGQLADRLGIDRFYVEGYSAGGPHALACAYALPERVIAAAAVSSVAPMGRPGAYAGMPLPNQMLARSARCLPWLTRLVRWAMRRVALGDVEQATRQLMSSIPASDKAALYAPENRDILVSALREGFRQGSRAVAQDDTLINRDWGFPLSGIRPRVDVWHGEADVNVPVHAGRYLRDNLPHARATFIAGAGHFLILERWLEIVAALVQPDPESGRQRQDVPASGTADSLSKPSTNA